MDEEIDFSRLANELPVPPDGAARARRTVARRRIRRQVSGSAFALLLIVGVGFGVLRSIHSGPDHVTIDNATHTTDTPLPTTTTNPDPRAGYIGSEHTTEGSGLPVDARFLGERAPVRADGTWKVGDPFAYWVRDSHGDMVWYDVVVSVDSVRDVLTTKTVAIFSVNPLGADQSVCIDSCGSVGKSTVALGVIGVWSGDGKFTSAYTIDFVNNTLVPREFTDLTPSPDYDNSSTTVVNPPDPPRPALYGDVALCKQDTCPWYTANEHVTAGGGGGFSDAYTVTYLVDSKENKYVAVWTNGAGVYDTLVVDESMGQPVANPTNWKYKGKTNQPILIILDGNTVTAAWLLDSTTHKIESVKASDVTPVD